MRIEIEIPKEFEKHFKEDKFKDSFERIMADIKGSIKSRNRFCVCAGRYEYETIEMLQKAFENSRQVYDIDKVVEKLESFAKLAEDRWMNGTSKHAYQEHKCWVKAIEIVKQGVTTDDMCEWNKVDEEGYSNCRNDYDETYPDFFKYCPYCSKKINVVE